MAWTPRRKAFVFASTLILVSTALLGTAVADATGALRPFLRGDDYGSERSLTRGQHATLAFHVGQEVGDEIRPAPGAVVALTLVPEAGRPVRLEAATKTTDDHGRALFLLRPGTYQVVVTFGRLSSTHEILLRHSERAGVVFDEDGQAHWNEHPQREIERHRGAAALLVRVGRNESGHVSPVPNATVRVFSLDHEDSHPEPVATHQTGPRGATAFDLRRGHYRIQVEVGDIQGEKQIELAHPMGLGALIDGTQVHWVPLHPDHRPGHSGQPHGPHG